MARSLEEAREQPIRVGRWTARFGALAIIVFALAGIAWFALELAPVRLGFEDTDDPAVSLRFLREHQDIYIQAGIVLILMAISLTVATFAVWDVLAPRADALAIRAATRPIYWQASRRSSRGPHGICQSVPSARGGHARREPRDGGRMWFDSCADTCRL